MSRTRDEKILSALTIRINALKREYGDITAEIEAVGAYMDQLVAEAWELHHHIGQMRGAAFIVWERTKAAPSEREAA